MDNIFEQGLAALKETLTNSVETSVLYVHNSVEYPITATRGAINWGTLNRLGDISLGENHRDYIIRAELLSFEPQNGDRIKDGSDVFEVYNDSTSSKCWRFSDPYKSLIRVYTRRIGR